MTTTSSPTPNGTVRRPGLGGLSASFRFGLPSVVSKGRLLGGLGLLGLVVLQFYAFTPEDFENEGVSLTTVFVGLVIALLIPIFAVSTASNALGTPVSDGTLVYPWLRPTPRWQLALGHIGAALALNLPVGVLTAGGGMLALLSKADLLGTPEGNRLILGSIVAGAAAALAYTPLVVALGARYKRASTFAFVYIFLWEQLFARNSTGVSRLAIQTYVRGTFNGIVNEGSLSELEVSLSGAPPGGGTPGLTVSLLVIAGLIVAGTLLTALVLKRADVE